MTKDVESKEQTKSRPTLLLQTEVKLKSTKHRSRSSKDNIYRNLNKYTYHFLKYKHT